MDIDQFSTHVFPTWCPGCGNYGIWLALKQACINLGLQSHEIVIVYGVGCHGNMRDWMNVYGIQGLHGRAIPLAQGVKLANPKLNVIVVTGDGDCLGEGGNHFLHALRRNIDITVLIHDNQVYGLTTGQASPTAQQGMKTKSTPNGVVEHPVNPLTIALAAGGTFLGRGFSGNTAHLATVISRAIQHPGFSVVDILQPCVTFDPVHTYQWYRERISVVAGEGAGVDKKKVFELASEWGKTIPIGILYCQNASTPSISSDSPLFPKILDATIKGKVISEFR